MLAHRRFFQIISMIVVFTLLFSIVSLPSVSAQGGDGLKRQVNPQTGKISFLEPKDGPVLPASAALGKSIRPQDPAMALAKRFGPEFGLKNPERELTELKTARAEDGRITTRYQQNHEGIPVMGGELIINTNESGDLYSMNGEVSSNLSLSTQPAISAEQAKQTALQAAAKWYQKTSEDFFASEPALWIYDESLLRSSTRPAELVWRMEVTPRDTSMPVRELVLVNAQRGGISLHFNQVDTAWSRSTTANLSSNPDHPAALVGATWYVATTGNDSNSCSSAGSPCKTINGAIGKASAGDTIKIAVGTYAGTGTEVVLINKSITLSGGWAAGFTTQSGQSTIDGQSVRYGIIVSGNPVIIDRFRIQNGHAPNSGSGAGISNAGNLTLSNSVMSGNVSDWMGGGIYNQGLLVVNNTLISDNISGASSCGAGGGGGIENSNQGTVTLNTSTVSGNTAYCGSGGGIHNYGTFTINNSTISDNHGAGIHDDGSGTLTLNNSTVSSNVIGGIYKREGQINVSNSTVTANGYGIVLDIGTVVMKNSIIASNTSIDCYGQINSAGYNLIGTNTNCSFTSTTGDLVGTSTNSVNPLLKPLQNNGGPTWTHVLMAGSPALNAGNPAVPGSGGNTCLASDQRGVARPAGGRCDIGATEGSVAWNATAQVSTYTANNGTSLPGAFVCNQTNPTCSNGDAHAKAAHKFAIGSYYLYATQHGRNSIDNNGKHIISTVHYDSFYNNAFWNGSQMVYGDAEGFPLADDVVAHELTHGVTEHESNLFYYYQSGAINESFSDVWGEYYDQTNNMGTDAGNEWALGEDLPNSGTIRHMSEPTGFGDPDKITSPSYYKGEEDNGGVHTNSGVNNKAVFLMVDGGDFNGKTVTGLGWAKTIAIYYEVNTKLLSSGADYSDLYYAVQQACSNLTGQKGITAVNCVEVKEALDAVEMNGQPAANFNTDAPLCAAGSGPSIIFADNLESGTANWTFNNGAYPRWQLDSPFGPFAQSGLHSLFANDYPDVVTDATARLKPLTIPANAYLHFAHAYGFESGYNIGDPTFYDFDGGVLEYSINNGATWADAGSLINFNGYTGVLFTGADNPLSGRSAFAGDSHGYISTRLNLASLAGKTVIFRWRMGLDQAGYDWGWWVDNVKLYTCTPPPTAFNKITPANSATNQSANVTLSWGASAGATSYQYCYDTTNDNSCTSWTSNGTSTSKVLSGLSLKTTYYWQVRAINSVGTTYANGSPTAFWSFRTLDPPGAFNKTSPSNGSTGVNLSTTLSWNSSPFASSYQYCYDLINDNQCNRTWSFAPSTSVDISNLGTNTTYYWQVRAVNAAGTTEADSSSWRSFTTTSTLPAGLTKIEAFIGAIRQGSYTLANGQSLRENYTGVDNGPVKISSTNANLIIGAERLIYKVNGVNTSFSEMIGLPSSELDNVYWLPWYNNVNLDTQLRFANATNNSATVTITIGSTTMPTINLAAGESTRISYPDVDSGPVKIESTQNIVASERIIYKVNNVNTSFSEMMALPEKQLDTTYWLPWYNNVNLDTQLRFANVTNSPATVTITIGNTTMPTINLAAGESTRISYPDVDSGPVKIESTQNIVASERVIYKVNNIHTSFSEMMALPNNKLSTTYWMPWYNNLTLDTQLRIANVSSNPATVTVTIGGVAQAPLNLAAGESTRISYPSIDSGPVMIESTQNIVAAERVIYKVNNVNTSFSEMMALPDALLDVTYWFPWYNNVNLDTQLRFGVP